MFKIRLLILLPISFFLLSCTKDNQNLNKGKYSVGYIGGEYDGLVLKNILTSNLSNIGLYDQNSNFKIKSRISHSGSLFITNIDNTSDRMRINSELNIDIINKRFGCVTHKYTGNVSQFYIFADSDKFISNNRAEKKIREENSEALVKEFINKLKKPKAICRKLNE